MKETQTRAKSDRLLKVVKITGGISMLIGATALAGRILGLNIISSIYSSYIPMAPATGILSMVFGGIFLSGTYLAPKGLLRTGSIFLFLLMSSYGFLKFLEYWLSLDLTLDSLVFPVTEKLGRFPLNRISPITGFMFFICGIASLIKMFSFNRKVHLNILGWTGLAVFYGGFTGFMGYVMGSPLLYGGNMIPFSLPTTLVFILLGLALVAMSEKESYILRQFSGESASGRLLKVILPVILGFLLADDIVDAVIQKIPWINHILVSSAFALLIIPATAITVIRVSKVVFKRAEKAEEERRKAESALAESEKKYRILIQSLGEGIGLVDPSENFVYTNPAAEEIFGVGKDGLAGRNLSEFISAPQLEMLAEETKKRSQAESSAYELEIVTPQNERRFLQITASPQFNEQGVFTGTFGVFRNITKQKAVQAELEKYAEALRESNATKDKFFSIIAHDLKGPFNSILGLTNILINEADILDRNEIDETLATIKRSSEKAFDLLENLLLWATSQTGRMTFDPEEFDLTAVIDETISLAETQAKRKHISIVFECDLECIVTGDQQMIQTIIRNLISNSVKFTPEGGIVRIEVQTTDTASQVSVIDSGVGIARKELAKLFRIESKYSTSGTANEKGTGLGLILCKEFVEKHQGKIWAESTVGKGSTFSFTIPAQIHIG